MDCVSNTKYVSSHYDLLKFVDASASDTELQRNILFHCPKKSAVEAVGQNKANGTTQAVAVYTLSLAPKPFLKQVQTIDHIKITPVKNPIIPVSASS